MNTHPLAGIPNASVQVKISAAAVKKIPPLTRNASACGVFLRSTGRAAAIEAYTKIRDTAAKVAFNLKLPAAEKLNTSIAKAAIETDGVRKRGCTMPKIAGKSACSAMAKVRRGV